MPAPDRTPTFPLDWIASRLGTCARCMRTAFGSALVASVLAAFGTILAPSMWPTVALQLAAVALAALWLAHLLAYATRAARRLGRETVYRREGEAVFPSAGPRRRAYSRREFVWHGVKAFALAAFVTAFPAGMSRAQTACTVTSCSDPDCVCVEPTPKCVFCPNRSEVGCLPSAAVPCCSNALFWYCLNGTQCNGDGTYTPYCR
ncbi:MAG TPA: hypothetical protein VEB68_05350 [Croceibacterium sp.]|nr:hypothetical protein [Croceibacterium sp.]